MDHSFKFCRRGHSYEKTPPYITKSGSRQCRVCHKMSIDKRAQRGPSPEWLQRQAEKAELTAKKTQEILAEIERQGGHGNALLRNVAKSLTKHRKTVREWIKNHITNLYISDGVICQKGFKP